MAVNSTGNNFALNSGFWNGGSSSTPITRRPFDYDGDGRADLSVRRPSTGFWYILRGTAGYMVMAWGVATDNVTPADFDGDGKTDVAVFRPSTGTWFWFNSGSQTFQQDSWGAPGDLPVPADHDADHKADLVIFRPSTGTWYRKMSADSSFSVTGFGVAGDKPVVGDFDGDGKADIAIFRPSRRQLVHPENRVWFLYPDVGPDRRPTGTGRF